MVEHVTVTYNKNDASWREDKWLVVYPSGGANAFEKKKNAVMEAKRFAKDNKPKEVVIEKMDGSTSKMHKYGFR